MNLHHYNKTSYKLSKDLTNAYSTSFSLGIKLFKPEYRDPIYALYGFVRIADEIVDTFHDYDKKGLFNRFRDDTFKAIEEGISTNPILNSFQEIVNKYNIDNELIEAFLNSMEMDLYDSSYNRKEYDNYVYGSAEVVGLMCLRIFTFEDKSKYDELWGYAKALGSAFQKVNFLRDIRSDMDERGRIYLPGVHKTEEINNHNKKKLEAEIEKEFKEALKGIHQLPMAVKLGVYVAYVYYVRLFRKIQRLDTKQLMKQRVRVSTIGKLVLLFKSFWEIRILNIST